jgi:hypothetical protein
LLGLKLPANFNRPYAAESVPDFWRRWHITLSNWLRDYLYFSLPGLRSKWKIFAYTNLIVTMLGGCGTARLELRTMGLSRCGLRSRALGKLVPWNGGPPVF